MSGFYRFVVTILRFWLSLSGYEIIGRENIPTDQAVIVICNHVHMADPILLGCAFPYQLHYIAKDELRQSFYRRRFLSSLGVVFVKRGEADLTAMRKAMAILKEGQAVAIFPEGSRSHGRGLGKFKKGTAFLAQKSGVKIIPAAVINSPDFFRFWKKNKKVLIGEPFSIEPSQNGKGHVLEEYTDIMRDKVAFLIEKGNKMTINIEGKRS